MKNLVFGILIGLGSVLLTAAYVNQENIVSEDSGTIATIHVVEKATRVIIRTTVNGEETSKAVNIDAGYVEEEDMVNFQPVLDELNKLRAQGYELQSSSLASITFGRSSNMRPYHSFIFVKK